MNLMSVVSFIVPLFFISSVAHSHVLRETGCPPEEDIEPCTCASNYLVCMNVNNAETLRTVFLNSARYTYNEVNISFSSIPYLPHEMFEQAVIKNLVLYNVTMVQLFDVAPSSANSIDKLHIQNTVVSRRLPWELLEHMSQLRLLNIYDNSVKTIDDNFSKFVPKTLQQLTFYATETKRIKPGVFVEFVNLNKVAVDACELATLTRDIFPRPFNVMYLYFNDNKITSIPEDLFVDMPRLQTLSMRNNLISTVPESAFDRGISSITYVRFEDNPLKCDCLLVWMVRDKSEVLGGSCASPKRLHGRELKDLSTSDFNC